LYITGLNIEKFYESVTALSGALGSFWLPLAQLRGSVVSRVFLSESVVLDR
jgi:hypothetical protein